MSRLRVMWEVLRGSAVLYRVEVDGAIYARDGRHLHADECRFTYRTYAEIERTTTSRGGHVTFDGLERPCQ